MLSRQAPQLGSALIQGGVSAQSANAAMNLTGQCQAELVHRGPVTIDPTRKPMRLITPDTSPLYPGPLPGPTNIPEKPPKKPKPPKNISEP